MNDCLDLEILNAVTYATDRHHLVDHLNVARRASHPRNFVSREQTRREILEVQSPSTFLGLHSSWSSVNYDLSPNHDDDDSLKF